MVRIHLDRNTLLARKTLVGKLLRLPNGTHEMVRLSQWHWNRLDKITTDSWSFDGILYGALTMIEEGWPGDLSVQISKMIYACDAHMTDSQLQPANDNITKELYAI